MNRFKAAQKLAGTAEFQNLLEEHLASGKRKLMKSECPENVKINVKDLASE